MHIKLQFVKHVSNLYGLLELILYYIICNVLINALIVTRKYLHVYNFKYMCLEWRGNDLNKYD